MRRGRRLTALRRTACPPPSAPAASTLEALFKGLGEDIRQGMDSLASSLREDSTAMRGDMAAMRGEVGKLTASVDATRTTLQHYLALRCDVRKDS